MVMDLMVFYTVLYPQLHEYCGVEVDSFLLLQLWLADYKCVYLVG
jgi:hypothetical protein